MLLPFSHGADILKQIAALRLDTTRQLHDVREDVVRLRMDMTTVQSELVRLKSALRTVGNDIISTTLELRAKYFLPPLIVIYSLLSRTIYVLTRPSLDQAGITRLSAWKT